MENHDPGEHVVAFQVDVNNDPIHWLSAAGMMILVIILILINMSLISSVREVRQKNKDRDTSKSVLCSIVTTISFATAAITCLITTILTIISNDFYHHTVVGDMCSKASISFYTLSQTFMIYVFITRIDDAFGGSAVQYPPIIIRSLYFTFIIFFIFNIFMVIALTFELMNVFLVLIFIWMILFLSLSIILCILFVRKANLLLDLTSSTSGNVDKDVLYVIIKQSILVPIAICTSFACFILVFLVQYLTWSTEWVPAAIFWIVVDCAVSAIGIFLLFSFNNDIYAKYCHSLHACCEKNKLSHMELSDTTRTRPASLSKVHDVVEPSQPTYTHTTKIQISSCKSTATASSNKQLLQVTSTKYEEKHSVSPYAMEPISAISAPKSNNKNQKHPPNVHDNDDTPPSKPKLAIVESLKRIVAIGKDKDTKNVFSVNLMEAHNRPKLVVAQSAPVPRFGGDKTINKGHQATNSWKI